MHLAGVPTAADVDQEQRSLRFSTLPGRFAETFTFGICSIVSEAGKRFLMVWVKLGI